MDDGQLLAEIRKIIQQELKVLLHDNSLRSLIREELICSKIIRGATAIKKVLGIKTTKTLMKYYNEYGLPMVKGKLGHWEIHSDSIKDWMGTRSLMARKAGELGFKTGGNARHTRLERLTEFQMAQVVAAIREDNAR